MKSIFIKKVTSEGKRKVINIPKKIDIEVGDDVLVRKVDLNKMEMQND